MLEAAGALRLSRQVASFVVPLGAALNRSGSALFQGAAVVFLAWLYDARLPTGALAGAVLATFLVSLTVASIPSAGVLTLAPALGNVGVPLDGLTILLGVDRIPDMFRTAVNVTGDMAAVAVFGAAAEGRKAGRAEEPGRPRRTDMRRMSEMGDDG
jgi:Na+/H+-dicarboxylate symporter